MSPVALPAIAAVAGATLVDIPSPGTTPTITGISHASGAIRPGDLYAALPGTHRHGAQFAGAAVAAGAVAVLTDAGGAALVSGSGIGVPVLVVADVRAVLGEVASHVYGCPTARIPVIGITGTAGKTTTAYLIESGLAAAGHTTALVGTVETRLAGTVVESERTTPEATDLHALFAAALELGVTAAVMEVSSHALTYGRVGGVSFAVGGYTNFGLDHLDFHGDAGEYFAAKARLFDGRCAVEVLNADDPALAPLRKAATITYSAAGDPDATWWASQISEDGYGQRFLAHGPTGPVPAGVCLPGRHNVANALLAIAGLQALGMNAAVAAAGVAGCPGVPGRLERVAAPGPVIGVVDYGHKPDSIVAVLAALRRLVGAGSGRLIAVLGAGGDRDRGKRPLMGAAAAAGADVVVVTDDNPRTEDPAAIRAQVRVGAEAAGDSATVLEVAGRAAAIEAAVAMADAGDVVVLLGKGHERGQEVADAVVPFDDRVELATALAHRFAPTGPRA